MKISSTTFEIASTLGDEAALRILSEAGFDAVDFGMFYKPNDEHFVKSEEEMKQYFTELRKKAEGFGIEIHQAHSPMTSYLYTGDEEPGHKYLDLQIKAIKAASYMGCKFLVIHPVILPDHRYSQHAEEAREINFKYYSKLKPFAEAYGVKIAIENMWNWDEAKQHIVPTVCSTAKEMMEYVDMMGHDCFTNCLDIGHAYLTGEKPQNMICALGDYLGCVHTHDVRLDQDMHDAPYTGAIYWPAVMKALKAIGYKGTLSFESDTHFNKFGPRLFAESARMLHAIGEDLVRTMD